jgi:hypothetical protein
VDWRDQDKVQRVLTDDEPGIVHLHGWFESPESVVLDIRSYERVINDEFMRVTLQATAYSNSIVFIGFGSGLDDPNFSRFRLWIRDVLSNVSNRHYRLCRNDEIPQLVNDHKADSSLRVVPFGAHHDELAMYLRSLAPEKTGLGVALHSAQASPPVAAVAEQQAVSSVAPAQERNRPLKTVPVSQVLPGTFGQVLPPLAQLSSNESSTAVRQAIEQHAPALMQAVRQKRQAS